MGAEILKGILRKAKNKITLVLISILKVLSAEEESDYQKGRETVAGKP